MIDPRSPELNYVVVAGVQSPGVAKLTGVKAPYMYDVQPAYGREGAVTIFKGRGIAKPLLTLKFFEPKHFIAWDAFKQLLKPPTPTKPLVLQMRHPLLTSAGIDAVAVEELGEPERQTNGEWIASIQLIEYRPLKPVLVKPRGSVPSPEKGTPIAPKTEADRALVKAQADAAAARDRLRL